MPMNDWILDENGYPIEGDPLSPEELYLSGDDWKYHPAESWRLLGNREGWENLARPVIAGGLSAGALAAAYPAALIYNLATGAWELATERLPAAVRAATSSDLFNDVPTGPLTEEQFDQYSQYGFEPGLSTDDAGALLEGVGTLAGAGGFTKVPDGGPSLRSGVSGPGSGLRPPETPRSRTTVPESQPPTLETAAPVRSVVERQPAPDYSMPQDLNLGGDFMFANSSKGAGVIPALSATEPAISRFPNLKDIRLDPFTAEEREMALWNLHSLPLAEENRRWFGEWDPNQIDTRDIGFIHSMNPSVVNDRVGYGRAYGVEAIPSNQGIVAHQSSVTIPGVERYIYNTEPFKPPLVYRSPNGNIHALDGHHRLSAQMLAGRDPASLIIPSYDIGRSYKGNRDPYNYANRSRGAGVVPGLSVVDRQHPANRRLPEYTDEFEPPVIPDEGPLSLYHVTDKGTLPAILESGIMNGRLGENFQGFEPEYQGVYGWHSLNRAAMEAERAREAGIDPVVLKVDVPPEAWDRLRPDEDTGYDDWMQSYEDMSAAVEGDVPTSWISDVYSANRSKETGLVPGISLVDRQHPANRLPMDEASRNARRLQMGYDLPAWHGTTSPYDFSEFATGHIPRQYRETLDEDGYPIGGKGPYFDEEDIEYAITGSGDPNSYIGPHAATDPRTASSFTQETGPAWYARNNRVHVDPNEAEAGPRVYPLYYNSKNIKDFDSEVELADYMFGSDINWDPIFDELGLDDRDVINWRWGFMKDYEAGRELGNFMQGDKALKPIGLAEARSSPDWDINQFFDNLYETDPEFRRSANEAFYYRADSRNRDPEFGDQLRRTVGDAARSALEAEGVTTVRYPNAVEGGTGLIAVAPPRSVHAAFDPERANDPNILAANRSKGAGLVPLLGDDGQPRQFYHGGTRNPVESSRPVYLGYDRELAQGYADDAAEAFGQPPQVYSNRVQMQNPLVLDTPEKINWAFAASGGHDRGINTVAGNSGLPFYSAEGDSVQGRLNTWAREQGYDGIVVPPSVFDTDEGWKAAAGSFGDPQVVVFNPKDQLFANNRGAGLVPGLSVVDRQHPANAPIRAWHGSPYTFDRFERRDRTGEGNMTYGDGLYFAEARPTAEYYRNSFFRTHPVHAWEPEFTTPRLYEVDINANPDHLLDWDAPYNRQPEFIQDKLNQLIQPDQETLDYWKQNLINDWFENGPAGYPEDRLRRVFDEAVKYGGYGPEFDWRVWDELAEAAPTAGGEFQDVMFRQGTQISPDDPGNVLYGLLKDRHSTWDSVNKLMNWADPSSVLNNHGVRGIRFLDQQSRGPNVDKRTSNYVIFDPSIVDIVNRYREGGGVHA